MKNKIIYSIDRDDVQRVAEENLDRDLTKGEMEIVEEELPEAIPFWDIIETIIQQCGFPKRLTREDIRQGREEI